MRFSDKYGFYELNPFPGSNQIVVSNHAFIYPEHRGQGRGKQQHLERLHKAREFGYDYILCTVNEKNDIEIHILRKYNWVKMTFFWSRETDHGVLLFGRNLVHVPELNSIVSPNVDYYG